MGEGVSLAITCDFRFESRPDREIVELETDHHTAKVCEHCLTMIVVHRRIHKMKIENVILAMAEE